MKVGLFIPCYVDAVYPEVGVATYKLLRHLGLDVTYPEKQTCCGQPMANAGFEKQAIPLAENFDDKFSGFDYVVSPSVSCTAFIRLNYPRLLNHDCETAKRCMDVIEFLHDVVKVDRRLGTFPYKVSLHNSCHGVRELGLSSPSEQHVAKFNKIKDLLELVDGIQVVEPERPDESPRRVLWFRWHVLCGGDRRIRTDGSRQGGTPYSDRCRIRDRSRLLVSDAHGWYSQEAEDEYSV